MDSVYLGCWKKSTLERIGLFDEELVRNQDDELNLRLIKAGYKIWQSPRIKSWYYPRASIRALFKQYVQYGYWKVKVIQKHKIPASLRHIIPGSFTGILILIVFLSPLSILFVWLFLGLIGFYSLVNILATIITCSELLSFKFLPVMPLIFAAYHFGYGYGFIRGIIDFVIFRQKKVNHNLTKITRDFNV
jgi:cellulose synthase/poly-beta-1,6-N-acetylglucosamine synthase-like glycosyltransferase